jgi:hypothetical protein
MFSITHDDIDDGGSRLKSLPGTLRSQALVVPASYD